MIINRSAGARNTEFHLNKAVPHLRNTAYSSGKMGLLKFGKERIWKESVMPSMQMIRTAATALGAAALSSCTTMPATPYQPYRAYSAGGVHGGYSEQQLAPDRYVVRFHGNALTPRDRVEGYMLYRAADLTVQRGFDWFMVVDRNTEHNVRTIVRPDPFYRPWYGLGYEAWRPNWNVYVPGHGWNSIYGGDLSATAEFDVRHIETFETTAEIQMGKAPMPANEPRAIDARKVMADLGPTVERPKS